LVSITERRALPIGEPTRHCAGYFETPLAAAGFPAIVVEEVIAHGIRGLRIARKFVVAR